MLKKLFVAAFVAIMSLSAYAQSTLKFGTVDLQAVMNDMPETAVLEKELADRSNKFQTEAKKMAEELQTKYQTYIEQRDSLDDVTRQMREEEISTLQQRAQQYEQASYNQISQYREQQLAMIQEKLFKAVKTVGDREKFVAIFPINDATYFSPTETTDVTSKIKTELGIK